jgi:protein SCO1/2
MRASLLRRFSAALPLRILAILVLLPAALGPRPSRAQMLAPPVAAIAPFSLTASDGTAVTDRTYRGKWLLVYFGYTTCPDICPTALSEMGAALDLLGPLADAVQPLFVTIDPRRDTIDVMASYVSGFHRRLVGLTGTLQQVAAAARAYHVFYERDESESGAFEHSAYLYLVDRAGELVELLPPDATGKQIAGELAELMQRP